MKNPTILEKEIQRLEESLEEIDAGDKEYYRVMAHLEKLYELNDTKKVKFRPSADTIVLVTANLLGTLLVLNHERLNVLPKALGILSKIKP